MYLKHFGLREPPFSLTPDPAFFLNRVGYQDGLNVLLVALRSGEGFVKITGEVGTGKSLLCRKLIRTLDTDFATAYLHNPYLDPKSLLLAVADELKLQVGAYTGRHALLKRLAKHLLDTHRAGRRVVLALDEAQAIPVETLETLRLLTNLETDKRKLLQVVLFGQPELDVVLSEPSVRQLKQRITFSYHLLPLSRPSLDIYIAHRLGVAGYDGPPLFPRNALDAVYRGSGGIPRLVNVISHKSMMATFGKGAYTVTRAFVNEAVRDTASAREVRASSRLWEFAPFRWLTPKRA